MEFLFAGLQILPYLGIRIKTAVITIMSVKRSLVFLANLFAKPGIFIQVPIKILKYFNFINHYVKSKPDLLRLVVGYVWMYDYG